jgi:hypothetical protein
MLLQRRPLTFCLEDKQGGEGEDIKKRETEFYSETLSFSHPSIPLKATSNNPQFVTPAKAGVQ